MSANSYSRNDICGLILAGGAGRRTGGRDKGLIKWHGKSLVAHVIQRLAPQVPQLLLNCNRNAEAYSKFGLPLVADRREDFQGPLAGIEAAIKTVEREFLLVAPCDTPDLPTDLAARLLQAFAGKDGKQLDISYVHDGEREHYLCAMLRSRALADVVDYLDSGQRSVRGWYARLCSTAVDFSDQRAAFANLNEL